MTDPPTGEQLRAAVRQAQSVAQEVSDPQLREIAFGKILETLLAPARSVLGQSVPETRVKAEPRHERRAPARARHGPTAWVEEIRGEGFFKDGKTLGALTEEVRARGHNVESKNLTEPLEKLVKSKRLRRTRASSGGERGVWVYTDY